MTDFIGEIFQAYGLACLFLGGFTLEAILKRHHKHWCIPALLVYATTFIWYFIEPFYTPDHFNVFPQGIVEDAYLQIIEFLVFFRLFLPFFTKKFLRKALLPLNLIALNPERLLFYLTIIWLGLLIFGIFRLNGDIIGALVPIKARAGSQMWGRAAVDAGATGFIVSAAAYLYQLVCSFVGILLSLQARPLVRIINLMLFAVMLPYFIFVGARNQLLAVIFPAYFTYIIFNKQKVWIKILMTVGLFLLLNYLLSLIIVYRNVGLGYMVNTPGENAFALHGQKHEGLNMLEELCYINNFYRQGVLTISYGGHYLAELVNFIPRTIWPGKPLIGIDYAILRGFSDSSRDTGVFVTVSTGFMGQGIINFGPWLGAIAPGILLSIWAGFLTRLWIQRYSTLRLCLFLSALGVTFNLGRDLTLLVLFPIVFGYALVRGLEMIGTRKLNALATPYSRFR